MQRGTALTQELVDLAEGFHPRHIHAVDGLGKQAHVFDRRVPCHMVHHRPLQRAGRGKVQFRIHTQRIKLGCQRRQMPEVAVAQAAVGV